MVTFPVGAEGPDATQQPAFSVVLPTYNRADAVLQAVNSVLEQSFGDLELIVVDDCSTDDTLERLARVRDHRLRIVRNETNLGGAPSRNRGFSLARAQWICQIDSDDLWHVDMLANLAAGVAQASERVGVVYGTDLSIEFDSGEVLRRRVPTVEGYAFKQMLVRHFYHHCAAAIRKRALESVGGYDPELAGMEDTDLQHRLSEHWEVLGVPDAIYYYRLGRADQVTRDHDRRAFQMRKFLRKYDAELRGLPASRVKIVGVVMTECVRAGHWWHAAALWCDLALWSWAAPRRAYSYQRQLGALLFDRRGS